MRAVERVYVHIYDDDCGEISASASSGKPLIEMFVYARADADATVANTSGSNRTCKRRVVRKGRATGADKLPDIFRR